VARVPIHQGRTKTPIVVAFAQIDEPDLAWALRFRWRLDSYGYAIRTLPRPDGQHGRIPMHREILGLQPGDPGIADHINRDKLDNRRSNLRIVTRAANNQNRDAYANGRSRFRGVSWDSSRGLWRATAQANGEWKQIGRFPTEEEAARAAAEWRREHMPFSTEEVAA